MLTNPSDLTELEDKMRPGALSQQGFLGVDESLQTVLAWDAETLNDINISPNQIADKLENILNLALEYGRQRADPEQFRIKIPDLYDSKNIPQYSLETLPHQSHGYLFGDSHQVFMVTYRGMQECPWGCNQVPWSYFDFLLLNRQTGRQITGPGMIVHLISKHRFFEGLESLYRVDPWHAADVLDLNCPPYQVSGKFTFHTDPYADFFCDEIASEMQRLFGVSHPEAVARINQQWRRQSVTGIDIIYRETSEYWANTIYWEENSYW